MGATFPLHSVSMNTKFGPGEEFIVGLKIETTNGEEARDALIERFLTMNVQWKRRMRYASVLPRTHIICVDLEE